MRVVVQRVSEASVEVEHKIVGKINQGFLLYIGFHKDDNETNTMKAAQKVSKLRVFEDEQGKLNLSLKDISGEILAISQFTLYGDVKGSNRPSFIDVARPEFANQLYELFVNELKKDFHVETGIFQTHMNVSSVNDGPVTILVEY